MKLDMLGLTTADLLESLRFYRLLGLEIPETEPNEPFVETTLPNGLRISWNSVAMMKEIDPHWVQPVGHRMGTAFLFDSPDEVNQAHDKIVAAGFRSYKAPWDAFWGQRYAQVLDPDDNIVDLFCPL